MSFTVTQATQHDAPKLAEVFFAAFSDDFNRTMFPPEPDVRTWITEHLVGGKDAQKYEVFLKVTDPSNPDAVVAFAKWIRPLDTADRDRQEESGGPVWPVSSDTELCDRFFGTMDEHHHQLMGDRPHYCMSLPFCSPCKPFSCVLCNVHWELFCLRITSIDEIELTCTRS